MTKQITPIEANIATTKAVHDILFGTHDLTALDEYVASDIIQHVAHDPDVSGIEELRDYFEAMYAVIPDVSYELLESVADEDRVAYRIALTGTMEGDMPVGDEMIEATDDVVTWEAFSSFRFEDGMIVEANVVVDELTFLQSIGAVPEMGDFAA